MSWQNNEEKAYKWFCENYDSSAIYYGGSDSTKPDIYSPKFQCYIEIKSSKAQCGQFTKATAAKNPYSSHIINKEPYEKEWVEYDLRAKQIQYIIVVFSSHCQLYTVADFLKKAVIKLENRSSKKSGSRICTTKIREALVAKGYEVFLQGGRTYLINPTNEKIVLNGYTVQLSSEVRILSNTQNPTWIFSLEVKE